MSFAKTLIDKACGGVLSRRRLAAQLEEDPAFLTRVANGQAPMPASLAARLAEAAHEDPVAAVLTAVAEQERDPGKRERLMRLLGVDRLAEAVRFELTEELPPRQFSRLQP